MLILVGLGNPGPGYANNRHNIGFIAADAIHRRHGFALWRRKFQAEIADGTLDGDKVLLVKPMTYMNESGRAVGEILRFYKLKPSDVVVMHDELDLPPAKTRMKVGGGHGGHNGLRSISAHIGDGFRRLRIGIGHPGSKDLVHSYVLHDFAKVDAEWIDPLIEAIAENASQLAKGKDSAFANKLHLAVQPKKKPKQEKRTPEADPKSATADTAKSAQQKSTRGALADGLARLFKKNTD